MTNRTWGLIVGSMGLLLMLLATILTARSLQPTPSYLSILFVGALVLFMIGAVLISL